MSDSPAHPLGRLLRLARGRGSDVGGSRAEQVERLEREAEAYDELLMRRLEARGPNEAVADVPTDDEALIDTALYFAGQERLGQAKRLRRREVLRVAAIVGAGVVLVAAVVLAIAML